MAYNRDDFLELDRLYRAAQRRHRGIVIVSPRRFPQGQPSIGVLIAALEAFVVADPPNAGFVHWPQ